jgi:hypothetical protein
MNEYLASIICAGRTTGLGLGIVELAGSTSKSRTFANFGVARSGLINAAKKERKFAELAKKCLKGALEV